MSATVEVRAVGNAAIPPGPYPQCIQSDGKCLGTMLPVVEYNGSLRWVCSSGQSLHEIR